MSETKTNESLDAIERQPSGHLRNEGAGLKPGILAAAASAAALSACGGGSDEQAPSTAARPGDRAAQPVGVPLSTFAIKKLDAWRFLNQATFGPTQSQVNDLVGTNNNFNNWLSVQFSLPAFESNRLYKLTKDKYQPSDIGPLYGVLHLDHVTSAWWQHVLTSPDQLRARVAFALSQILVVGMSPGGLAEWPYMAASYYDMLYDNAFGSYKTLLTLVAGHPAMGMYLSHLSNRKPTQTGERIPDQNFARELLQLFTLGPDTYAQHDIEVLSHVFTGWSWESATFDAAPANRLDNVLAQTSQMKAFNAEHSQATHFPRLTLFGGDKTHRYPNNVNLGQTGYLALFHEPFTVTGDAATDRANVMNIICARQELAPFIALRMIQQLVTSNPSQGYVLRAAHAFSSQNLSLAALVRAILTDTEARDVATARSTPTFGKLREPLLRVTQFMRAFQATSVGGKYLTPSLSPVSADVHQSLGQGPLQSPSVFNFYRPGYVAPNSAMAQQGKVSPEMQICSETEVAAYVRFMEVASYKGFGYWVGADGKPTGNPLASTYFSIYPTYAEEHAVITDLANAAQVTSLLDLLNAKLFGGAMSGDLRAHLSNVLAAVNSDQSVALSVADKVKRGIRMVAMLCAIAPEYVVQR